VESPEEISQIFDEISYGKGSTILSMVEAYLGPDRFRAGVTRYLERFRDRNTVTTDLWNALADTTGEPVAAMLGPWVDRPGHPLVRASLVPEGLRLTQERFSIGGDGDPMVWPIPLVIEVNGRTKAIRFDTAEMVEPIPEGAVVHMNPGAAGFYRVLYDTELYDRLFRVLPGRSAADRWIVLEDLAAFLPSGAVGWPVFERFARALSGASERLVVESLTYSLSTGALCFPDHAPVVDLARSFFARQFDRVGLARRPGEHPSDPAVRETVTAARVRVDAGFARDLAETFVEWDRLDAEVRGAAAVARARTEGSAGYREIRRALEKAVTEIDVLRLERALAWSSDPALIAETLALTLDGTVNRGHAASVIMQASTNPVARGVTWEWLQRSIARVDELFRGSGFLSQTLETVIPYVGLGRSEEVTRFFAEHPLAEGDRGVSKGIERLQVLEKLGRRLPRT
jgi:tricorn protease interacting factor F2/3